MAILRVVPSKRKEGRWVVYKSGSIVSRNHRKQSGAVREMDRRASKGDAKYVHGRDGRVRLEETHGVVGPRGDI